MTIPSGLLPARASATHKGDVGHVVVVGGSASFSGAAALCSLGALRTGAGLVTLGIPKGLHEIMAAKLTEVMTLPLAQTPARSLSPAAIPAVLKMLDRADVLALGPGLSQQPLTKQFVRRLIQRLTRPLVLDADGLNALAGSAPPLQGLAQPAILTPHPGEMARLTGRSLTEIQQHRHEVAQEFSAKHRVILVLKGFETVVAGPERQTYVNHTGNPGMASGGMGDVLTGMIAALLGQRLAPFDAARLGVYLHGLAGDLAAEEIGQVGLIASDLIARIPLAIRRYQAQAAPA
jgi:NAD(P)H-hydrate epimerase